MEFYVHQLYSSLNLSLQVGEYVHHSLLFCVIIFQFLCLYHMEKFYLYVHYLQLLVKLEIFLSHTSCKIVPSGSFMCSTPILKFNVNSGWANSWKNWRVALWQKIVPSWPTSKNFFLTPSRSSWKCGLSFILWMLENNN